MTPLYIVKHNALRKYFAPRQFVLKHHNNNMLCMQNSKAIRKIKNGTIRFGFNFGNCSFS